MERVRLEVRAIREAVHALRVHQTADTQADIRHDRVADLENQKLLTDINVQRKQLHLAQLEALKEKQHELQVAEEAAKAHVKATTTAASLKQASDSQVLAAKKALTSVEVRP
jgi:hypothetical protein